MAEQKAVPLTEAQIRAIIREEIANSLPQIRAIIREEIANSLAQISNWMHDTDHGSIQERRFAQRERDRAAGLASE